MIKVMIIEDDPMVSFINTKYLGNISGVFTAASFDNGKDALAYLAGHRIDLIILDMYLPDMTGLEILKTLRAKGDMTEVIMVTADNSLDDIQTALSYGVLDYLIKPFEYDRFCQAVDKYFTKHGHDAKTDSLSQEDIDRMMSGNTAPSAPEPGQNTEKGIQRSTLDSLLSCLESFGGEAVSCGMIAEKSGLSKVTVRRYMNYLIDNDRAESLIDYQTGGRPRITYRLLG